jgi:hypothetical protein
MLDEEKRPLNAGKFVDWSACVRFLSSCLAVYGLVDGRLELTESDDFLAFYARPFLRNRKWSVIRLWEGDLRVLLMDQREEFSLTTVLRDRCLAAGWAWSWDSSARRTETGGLIGDRCDRT